MVSWLEMLPMLIIGPKVVLLCGHGDGGDIKCLAMPVVKPLCGLRVEDERAGSDLTVRHMGRLPHGWKVLRYLRKLERMDSLTGLVETSMACRNTTVRLWGHLKSCFRFFSVFPQLVGRVGEVFVCLFLYPNALKMSEPATAILLSLANLFFPTFLIPTFLSTLGFAPVVASA